MTKARSRGRVRPSYDPIPPAHGSSGFARVLARGCGGYNCNHPLDPSEYDCKHNYAWPCDDCPIVVDRDLKEEALLVCALFLLQGPPRKFSHPDEYWMFPEVATELHWVYDKMSIDRCLLRDKSLSPVGASVDSSSLFLGSKNE